MTNWFSWIGDVIFATMLRSALKCILRQNRQHTQKKHLLPLFCHFLLKTLEWKMFANLIPVFPLLRNNCKEKKSFSFFLSNEERRKKLRFSEKWIDQKNWGIISFQKKKHFHLVFIFVVEICSESVFELKKKKSRTNFVTFRHRWFCHSHNFCHNILTLSRSCRLSLGQNYSQMSKFHFIVFDAM